MTHFDSAAASATVNAYEPATRQAARPPLLEVSQLSAGHGGVDVISGISFSVQAGECVAMLGRNGAGKTTLLHSLFNIGPRHDGRIRLHGQRVDAWPGHRIARAGMALVPQGRGVFPNLSVGQSLGLARHSARHAPTGADSPITRDDVFRLWPRLAERQHTLCANLSGGERQLLALARALLTQARLIVLDEPSEGLAPRIIQDTLQPALHAMRAQGHTLLLAEQNIELALALATRVLVLAGHRLVFDDTPQQLQAQPHILQRHLGLA